MVPKSVNFFSPSSRSWSVIRSRALRGSGGMQGATHSAGQSSHLSISLRGVLSRQSSALKMTSAKQSQKPPASLRRHNCLWSGSQFTSVGNRQDQKRQSSPFRRTERFRSHSRDMVFTAPLHSRYHSETSSWARATANTVQAEKGRGRVSEGREDPILTTGSPQLEDCRS